MQYFTVIKRPLAMTRRYMMVLHRPSLIHHQTSNIQQYWSEFVKRTCQLCCFLMNDNRAALCGDVSTGQTRGRESISDSLVRNVNTSELLEVILSCSCSFFQHAGALFSATLVFYVLQRARAGLHFPRLLTSTCQRQTKISTKPTLL